MVLNYNQNQSDDSNIKALYIERYIDIDIPEKSKLSLWIGYHSPLLTPILRYIKQAFNLPCLWNMNLMCISDIFYMIIKMFYHLWVVLKILPWISPKHK